MSSLQNSHLPSSHGNTGGWLMFTYVSFALAAFMAGLGIWALPGDLWVKGYMMMAFIFLCGSTFTLAKTVRDEHEAKRFANNFCADCGSRLPRQAKDSDIVMIPAGSLDDAAPIMPQARIFFGSRASWSCTDGEIPVYPEFPPQ